MNNLMKRLVPIFLLLFMSQSYAADDGSAQISPAVWPMPTLYFSVELGSGMNSVAFQEVAGLEVAAQVIEYRAGNSPLFSTIKMPGIEKSGNVTLKNGIFVKDNQFYAWYNAVKMNTVKRENVTIKLLDETGAVLMSWTLHNAWPTQITATDLEPDGNEAAVETIELAYEELTITTN